LLIDDLFLLLGGDVVISLDLLDHLADRFALDHRMDRQIAEGADQREEKEHVQEGRTGPQRLEDFDRGGKHADQSLPERQGLCREIHPFIHEINSSSSSTGSESRAAL